MGEIYILKAISKEIFVLIFQIGIQCIRHHDYFPNKAGSPILFLLDPNQI